MSAKKSWDVQPNRAKKVVAKPVEAAPTRRTQAKPVVTPARRVAAKPVAVRTLPKGTLKERRKQKRSAARYVFFGVLIVFIVSVVALLWQPFLRIQEVSARGPGAETVTSITRSQLNGTYYFILPRNSVFLIPGEDIRSAVLDAHPEIAALSITRSSFTSLQIVATARANTFIWCGAAIDPRVPSQTCYDVDIEGLIFRPAEESSIGTASSTGTKLRVYAPLDRELAIGESPVRSRVSNADLLPDAVKFVGAVRELGVPVSSLALRGDEADLWLPGPTRITYVLGREQVAATLAASALPTLDFKSGTIEYVDLRFSGKAYIRRYGEGPSPDPEVTE